MISEREKMEFESLPEFVREPYSPTREPYAAPSSVKRGSIEPKIPKRPLFEESVEEKAESFTLPKSAELEALWPGVNHHDFLHSPRKTPSFYLTIGFMSGAVVALIVCWAYSGLFQGALSSFKSLDKKVVVAGEHSGNAREQHAAVSNRPTPSGNGELIVPMYPTYEVREGDTLAGIALQAYKRVSPRLLDEICRANDMRSAHVLNLGQKIILPEYRLQSQ